MPRLPDPLVVLAADTPLYAPALLAKAERITPACARMVFRISRTPRFHGPNRDEFDPFVHEVLAEACAGEHVVLGIGDPMRITAIPDAYDDEPFVVGTFIKKMCYWVVDRRQRCNDADCLSTRYSHLLVHPLGMTGYAVVYCDETRKSRNGQRNLNDVLIDMAIPGFEEEIYRRVTRKSSQQQPPPAFLTTDPLVEDYSRREESALLNVRSYLRTDHPDLAGAIMTGFITGKALYERENSVIDEILHGIRCAIELIEDSPVLAAAQLYKKAHLLELNFTHMEEPDRLIRALEIVAGKEVYDLDEGVDDQAWKRSLALRTMVEPLLPGEQSAWRLATKIETGFHKRRPDRGERMPQQEANDDPAPDDNHILVEPADWGRKTASGLIKGFAKHLSSVESGSTGVGFRKKWWLLAAVFGVLPLVLFLVMTYDFVIQQVSVGELAQLTQKPRHHESITWSLPIGLAALLWPLSVMAHVTSGLPKKLSMSAPYCIAAALALIAVVYVLVLVFLGVKESWLNVISVVGPTFLAVAQYGVRRRWFDRVALARQRRRQRREVDGIVAGIMHRLVDADA